jgi:hypothetical protein
MSRDVGFDDSEDEDVVFSSEVAHFVETDGAIVVRGDVPLSGVMHPFEDLGSEGRRYRGYTASIDRLTGFLRLIRVAPVSSDQS